MITLFFVISFTVTTTDSLNYPHLINEFYGISQNEYVEDEIDDDIYIYAEDIELSSDIVQITTDTVQTDSSTAQ